MANPTTYFGWVMPTATDLVTDLPADFAVFGQGVDTSMQYLLGGTTGQILSKTSGTNMAFTWINNDQGDITGVTAGTGISGGGTSGTVTVSIDTAVTVDKTTAQTLTNKTLTTPIISSINNTGTLTLPTSTDTLVGRATTDTLTNKTLTSPALTTPTISTATTNGDLLYGTGSGALTRLGIGSSAQILTVSSGIPAWTTPAASASGLTLISSTSFTTSSSHSVNNCFSATYVNYRILIKLSAQTGTNTDFTMRLRVSGTDATTSYISQRLYSAATTTGSDLNSAGTDDWLLHTISSTNPTAMSISSVDIFDPFPATPTQATNIAIGYYGGNNYGTFMALVNSNSTSYDGFSLIPAAGTITGTVRVYGYQNS